MSRAQSRQVAGSKAAVEIIFGEIATSCFCVLTTRYKSDELSAAGGGLFRAHGLSLHVTNIKVRSGESGTFIPWRQSCIQSAWWGRWRHPSGCPWGEARWARMHFLAVPQSGSPEATTCKGETLKWLTSDNSHNELATSRWSTNASYVIVLYIKWDYLCPELRDDSEKRAETGWRGDKEKESKDTTMEETEEKTAETRTKKGWKETKIVEWRQKRQTIGGKKSGGWGVDRADIQSRETQIDF